jgi:hypothetical protein
MSYSDDDDSSKNSLDTLRSTIFESQSHAIPKAEKKKKPEATSFTPSKYTSHSHLQNNNNNDNNYNNNYNSSSNIEDVARSHINQTAAVAMESELLGSRLTEEIRRLRGELQQSAGRQREGAQQLQEARRELEAARGRNKELEWINDNVQREMVRE